MGLKFNPAPGWPLPYGFEPPPGWEPDPDWPPAPPDWPLWIGRDAPRATAPAGPPAGRASGRGRRPPGRHAAGPHAVPPVNQAPVYAWKGQDMHRDVQPRPGTNGWAVASFLFSLLGGVLLAVPFGVVALVKIGQRPQRGKGLAVAGLVISGVWVVAVAAFLLDSAQVTASAGGASQGAGAGAVNFFSQRTGACFRDPLRHRSTGSVPTEVTSVPCTRAHNAQVFAQFHAVGGLKYPGRTALLRQGGHDCASVFKTKLDRSKLTKQMTLVDVVPLELPWFTGQRRISCVVIDPGRNVRTSLLKAHAAG